MHRFEFKNCGLGGDLDAVVDEVGGPPGVLRVGCVVGAKE